LGLAPSEAIRRAKELLDLLGTERLSVLPAVLDDVAIDVLHAACRLLVDSGLDHAASVLERASLLHAFLERATWPEPGFEERAELLAACAFMAWRTSRWSRSPVVHEWEGKFTAAARMPSPVRFRAEALLASMEELDDEALTGELDDTETLLTVCVRLRDQMETSTTSVRADAEFLYRSVEKPKRAIGVFDERDYFLGETALLAGTACRLLARREEATGWFERAEASFRLTVNAVADWSRVSYQRLALRLEERQFEELFEQLPGLIESFANLDMPEDRLKCRFLEALALMETGQLELAVEAFQSICGEARRLRNDRLIATAYANLVHVFGMLGQTEEALECSREAVSLFEAADNRLGLAKVQSGIGSLLRARGQFATAVDAYQEAQRRFSDLGMFADVATGHLVIADLLLELGQESTAIREILKALPIIDEFKMVPEGLAALALLRESVLKNRINRQALRELHGYFEELDR